MAEEGDKNKKPLTFAGKYSPRNLPKLTQAQLSHPCHRGLLFYLNRTHCSFAGVGLKAGSHIFWKVTIVQRKNQSLIRVPSC